MKREREVAVTFTRALTEHGGDYVVDGIGVPRDLLAKFQNPSWLLVPSAEIDEQPMRDKNTGEDCLRITYIPRGKSEKTQVLIPVRVVYSYREISRTKFCGD